MRAIESTDFAPLYILFGLSGSGKSFIARLLENKFGLKYIEGDDFLSSEMREAISKKQSFTQMMRDSLTETLILELESELRKLPQGHPGIVLSQALYKEKNRIRIHESFQNIHWIQVHAEDETLQRRNLLRPGRLDPDYLQQIKFNFEVPIQRQGVHLLVNGEKTTTETLLQEFSRLFPRLG